MLLQPKRIFVVVSSVPLEQTPSGVQITIDLLRQSDQELLKKLSNYELVNPQETTPFNRNEMFADVYLPVRKGWYGADEEE